MPTGQSLEGILQTYTKGKYIGKRKPYCDNPSHQFLRVKIDEKRRQCLGCGRSYFIADEPAPVPVETFKPNAGADEAMKQAREERMKKIKALSEVQGWLS